MDKIKIQTEKAPEPGGWYSQAYRVGDMVYTSGITAHDPVTQQLVAPGDIVGQTEQILKNMNEIDDFNKFNETYKKYFPQDPPARSTFQIAKFNDGIVIEIEAIATI